MIRYRTDSGYRYGEVWSPGPLPQTVWVLDTDAPAGAVVVNIRNADHPYRVSYAVPRPPRSVNSVSDDEIARAREIMRQFHAWARWYPYRYQSPTLRVDEPKRPSDDEYRWAHATIDRYETDRYSYELYREAHFETVSSCGPKKFRDLVNRDDRQCSAA